MRALTKKPASQGTLGAPGGPTESMDTPCIRLWAGVYPEIRYGDVIVNARSDQETSYLRNSHFKLGLVQIEHILHTESSK